MIRFATVALALLGFAALAAADPYVWHHATVNGGGFVSGIVAHPGARGLIYCRTDIGGAYRWDGDHWTSLSEWIDADHWNYTGTESLAVDPSDAQRVYIAAGTYTTQWAGTGAVLRSADRGDTWAVAPLPIKLGGNEDGRNNGERLAVDPHDGRVLYFGSRRDGLWHSTDAGVTWAAVPAFPAPLDPAGQGLAYVTFDAATGRPGQPTPDVYVGSSTGAPLYRSTDAGVTWAAVPGGPTGLLPHRAAWGAGRRLFLTYGDGPGPNGVTDGSVWRLDAPTQTWADVTPVRPTNGDRFGYCGVCVDPAHPDTVMAATLDRWSRTDDIFRSTDAGQSWHSIGRTATLDDANAPWLNFHQRRPPNGRLGHWIASVAIDPFDPDHALYTTGWGLWATHDLTDVDRGGPTAWHAAARGVEELVVTRVVSPAAGAAVLSAAWDVDGFRHADLGRSPPQGSYAPQVGRDADVDVAALAPDVVARVYGGQVLGHNFGPMTGGATSLDNGLTWTPFTVRPPNAIDGTIAVSADGGTFVWSPDKSTPSVSADHGHTWSPAAGLPARAAVVSDRVDPRRFYAFDRRGGTVYASTDAGRTFAPAATHLPRGDADLRAELSRPGHVWLATAAGLFRSADGARTFTPVPAVAHAGHVAFGRPARDGGDPAVYLNGTVVTTYGLFRSDDDGATWTRINDDRHQFGQISSLAGDPRLYGRLYLGSANFGTPYGDPAPAR